MQARLNPVSRKSAGFFLDDFMLAVLSIFGTIFTLFLPLVRLHKLTRLNLAKHGCK
jgi:hypothetical protein